jgi:hypothetical protein
MYEEISKPIACAISFVDLPISSVSGRTARTASWFRAIPLDLFDANLFLQRTLRFCIYSKNFYLQIIVWRLYLILIDKNWKILIC